MEPPDLESGRPPRQSARRNLLTSHLYPGPTPSRQEAKSQKPLRVLVYSRVSSPQQAQTGYSIKDQPEALRSYAKAQGWRVVGECTDPGKTGRNADRDGFKALMDSIKSLRPDGVVVTRLSRFMRNARLTLNAVHEMRGLGVALICKDEPIDTRQRGLPSPDKADALMLAFLESANKTRLWT